MATFRPQAPPKASDAVDAVERRMVDAVLGAAPLAPVGGESLTVTLLSRIKTLEDSVSELGARVKRRDATIAGLQAQLATATASRDDDDGGAAALRAQNASYARRLAAMERFLADYGLVWVGDGEDGSSIDPRAPGVSGVSASTAGGHAAGLDDADLSVFVLRLRQLNDKVGAGKAAVVKRKDGVHTLEVPTGVPFRIYRDGFYFSRGPFRAFNDPANKPFIQVGPCARLLS